MKFRIRYRSTIFLAFDAPNPAPWRLDVPAGLKYGMDRSDVPSSDHKDWSSAVARLEHLLGAAKRGYLYSRGVG